MQILSYLRMIHDATVAGFDASSLDLPSFSDLVDSSEMEAACFNLPSIKWDFTNFQKSVRAVPHVVFYYCFKYNSNIVFA